MAVKPVLVKSLILFWIGVLLMGPSIVAQAVAPATVPTQEYLVGATLYTQQAAEYRALCYQAYNLAALRLKEALQIKPLRPAVILDLDETVLDNSAYTAWQIVSDRSYEPDTWTAWTDLEAAPAVPGVTEFLHLADSLGVTLLYVSNRLVKEQAATMRNMQSLGLPQVSDEHFFLKTSTSDKSARRDSIAAQGYDVLLLIGDNLGDFDGIWDKQSNAVRRERTDASRAEFGSRYIVLPNAIYGTWEGALYDFNWKLSTQERDAKRREALEPGDLPTK